MIGASPSLTGTIIKRELLTGLRSGRSFLLLLLMLSVMYGAAFYAMDVAASDYTNMARVMQTLFILQAMVIGAISFAVIPAIAAVSINSEREEENYDLLLTTLITRRQIVLGKFLAVLIRALLMATAVLPFTGLVYFYAGVDVESFFGLAAFYLPAALCNAAVGICCSQYLARPARSIFVTFGIIAMLAGIIPAIWVLLANWSYLQDIEPFRTVLQFIYRGPWNAQLLYMGYQLVAGGLFLSAALVSLRGLRIALPLRFRRAGEAVKSTGATGRCSGAFIPIPDNANPLGYKDLYGSLVRSRVRAWSAFLILLGAYGLLGALLFEYAPESIMMLGFFERLFLLVVVPPATAVLLVKEREDTTFDMLRMTLLGPVALLFGKFAGVLRQLQPALIAILVGKCIFTGIGMTYVAGLRNSIPGFYFALDLLLLPPHLVLVVLASLAGAALPKKLVPAVCGAVVSTMVAALGILFMQASMSYSMGSDETELAVLFLLPHVVLLGFAYVIELGLALTFLVSRWGDQRRVEVLRGESAWRRG